MSLRAEDLKKSTATASAYEAVVKERLRMIDTAIQSAPRAFGRNVVKVSLDANFSLPGLDPREQQRYVYSEIIQSLKKRGFEVHILLDRRGAELYVAYEISFDQREVDAMNQILGKAMIEAADVPRLYEHAALNPPEGDRQ